MAIRSSSRRRGGLGHLFDRRAAVGLVGVHLVIRSRHGVPLGVCIDDGPRVRVGDEAVAKRRRRRRIRRLPQPLCDEVCGEGTDGSKLGQAPTGFLQRGRFLWPHECGPRRTSERPLPASVAALGLEREELGDVAVGEGRYRRKLVRVEESHARRGTVRPVGVVRELHTNVQIAPPAFRDAIDFNEHPAVRGRANVDE